jgi:hypothetical protein
MLCKKCSLKRGCPFRKAEAKGKVVVICSESDIKLDKRKQKVV